MGIFDKRDRRKSADEKEDIGEDSFQSGRTAEKTEPVKEAEVTTSKRSDKYGVEDITKLMRSLPLDENPELVVVVIQKTLESLGIRIEEIIEDATHREEEIIGRISKLNGEINNFEKEIKSRQSTILKLHTEVEEISKIREKLELTLRKSKQVKPGA